MENEKTIHDAENDKKITRSQQNALHLFYGLLAKELNEKGISMTTVLQRFVVDTPATKYTVKELIWRPLQEALTGKHSTTELLKKQEIDQIYDSLNKFFAERMKISIPPFPSSEDMFLKEFEK